MVRGCSPLFRQRKTDGSWCPSFRCLEVERAYKTTSMEEAKEIVRVWLQTAFSGAERHKRRLEKVAEIEEEEFGV